MKNNPLSESEIAGIIQQKVSQAIDYDRSEFRKDRVRAIDYFNGKMSDLPSEEGRSSIVSKDIADVIGYMMPGLMRVFFAGDDIVTFAPVGPEDEEAAKQATEYVNYLVLKETNGYEVFWDVFHDALLHANGIVKAWWEPFEKVTSYTFRNLTEDQVALLVNDPEVEVVEHESFTQIDPTTGEIVALSNIKIRRTEKVGRLRIEAVPPEQFLIDPTAKSIKDANFVAHRTIKTRSELLEAGYDEDVVASLPGYNGTLSFDRMEIARREQIGTLYNGNNFDNSTDEVEIIEAYLRVDYNGDGISETLKVVIGNNSTEILDWEEWESEYPFADFCAYRISHRWLGKSIFNDVEDVQRVKTVLVRQLLDNLYESNIPDRYVNADVVENLDSVYDRQIGNVILTKGNPAGAVVDRQVPFVAKEALTGLTYMDELTARRTGVSKDSMALDQQALRNQTATAVNAAQSAQYSKIELVARNFAEMGFVQFFKLVLKIIIANQDKPKVIRLRNKWVEFDPRPWNASMDCAISVGLGSGSKEKDLAILQGIAGKQEQILQMAGPQNPIVSMAQYANTLKKIVETAGIRDTTQFFSEVDPAQLAQQAQQPQKPNPEEQKAQMEMQMAQMEMQIEQGKAQAAQQLQEAKAQAEIQLQQAKTAAEQEIQNIKTQAEIQLSRERNLMELSLIREKNALEIQHKRELAAMNAQLKRDEMAQEVQLTQQSNVIDAVMKNGARPDTNINPQVTPDS